MSVQLAEKGVSARFPLVVPKQFWLQGAKDPLKTVVVWGAYTRSTLLPIVLIKRVTRSRS